MPTKIRQTKNNMNTELTDILFQPFQHKSLAIKNRFVMAPMTRVFSPNGVPTPDVAEYYARRAVGEVGLILTEGTVIDRPASANYRDIPHFYGKEALEGWGHVVDVVHRAHGVIGPQIWHVGIVPSGDPTWSPATPFEGPSGIRTPGVPGGVAMSENDIADTIAAYGRAAGEAKNLGFDMFEIHGAHGYLIDQFLWKETNHRTDAYGGKTVGERTRFAVDVVKAARKAVGEDFVICLRLSQWKQQAYDAQLASTPNEMEELLSPLVDAGVDIFHCSQRRFWEPEFEGSDLNFAGWAKKITGKPTITVGSVGLTGDFINAFSGESSSPSSLTELLRRYERGDFDMVAVGRALLSDSGWVRKIHEGRNSELRGFSKEALETLD
jgi:2,4-dienoyl-CoA reductase-like NADH-dependent reductase (Old Yellow Enzyme family)